jgi:hypothetical protein
MHRLPSKAALRNLRLGTVFLLLFGLALMVFVGLGLAAILTRDPAVVRVFLYTGGAVPLLGLLYLIFGSRTKCPLCMNPPLRPRRCQKHRNAKKLFGSYRLRVAFSVFSRGNFVCPHCGEPTLLEVRDRRRPRRR